MLTYVILGSLNFIYLIEYLLYFKIFIYEPDKSDGPNTVPDSIKFIGTNASAIMCIDCYIN